MGTTERITKTSNQDTSCPGGGAAVLNEWFASFGLNLEDDTTDTSAYSDEEGAFFSDSSVKVRSQCPPVAGGAGRSAGSRHCSPSTCRPSCGICVDCTRCLDHCQCGEVDQGLPPTCDTPGCSHIVCPDCMRCAVHCGCRTNVRGGHCGFVRDVGGASYDDGFAALEDVVGGSLSQHLRPQPLHDVGNEQRGGAMTNASIPKSSSRLPGRRTAGNGRF